MKVLLSFVGEQDPYSEKTNAEGAIVTLCRLLQPQLVYLLPTASGHNIRSETETNANNTKFWINDEISKEVRVFIRPVKIPNPTDYSLIIPTSRREIIGILTELVDEDVEIHLNCSSGTPQLKSTWSPLVNGIFISTMYKSGTATEAGLDCFSPLVIGIFIST